MKRLIFIAILFLIFAKVEASISLSLGESDHNFFAKDTIGRTLLICNDGLEPKDIIVSWNTSVFSAVIQKDEKKIALGELAGKDLHLVLEMPGVKQRSPITLTVQVICDGKLEAEKQWEYSIFPRNISDTVKNIIKNRKLGLIDFSGKIKRILNESEIPFTSLTNQLSIGAFQGDLIIIGPKEEPRMMPTLLSSVENKVADGISVISFQEKMEIGDQFIIPLTNLSPLPLNIKDITILSPNHPLFTGLTGNDFNNWRENGIVTSFPLIKPDKGNFRILAEADLSTTALLETFSGEGKFIFCQLPVIDKFNSEPIAQALFVNLIRYALVKQETMQPAVIHGNTETEMIEILNSLSVTQDITGKSNIAIICLDEKSEEIPHKEPTPIPPHIKEIIEKGGIILVFASLPKAVDFLRIKENIKRMRIAPATQQRIYRPSEDIIALEKGNPLLWGLDESGINLLIREGKMYKFQVGNANVIICQSSFYKDNPENFGVLSQLLTNLGIKIEKEAINEETNFEL